MRFLAGFKAQSLWLRGLKRFHQGRCDEAARLFTEAFNLDPKTYEVSSLHYSVLGRSYLALGQADNALAMLSRAHDLFHADDRSRWRDFEWQEFVLTLKAFANALHRCGQFERAKQVAQEVTEYAGAPQTKT